MAEEKNKKKEEKPAINLTDEDLLLSEDELLGLTPSGGAGTSGPPKPPVSSKFHIPDIVKEKYPDLIPLILETESMDDEEREYWFQILPIMTEEQVQKFREILVTEKEQLAKLDSEYEKELEKINEKHLQEWQEFEMKQKREEIEKAETAEEKEETAMEADLLKKLQEL